MRQVRQLLPKPALRKVRSSAPSFKFQYLLIFLRLSSNRLRIHPRLPSSSIFLPIPPFKRKFPSMMRPIQLAFLDFIISKIFLSSLTLCNTSSYFIKSAQLISALLQHHMSELLRYSVILSVLDPRKCEYLKDYSLDFEHAYMTTYLAS